MAKAEPLIRFETDHSIIVSINGESFRLKDKHKAGLLGGAPKVPKR